MRSLALLRTVLLLSPCLACQSNTVPIETTEGSSSGSTSGSTTSVEPSSTTDAPPSPTTIDPDDTTVGSATFSTTMVGPDDTTSTGPDDTTTSIDPTGQVLDVNVDPPELPPISLLAVETIVAPGLPLQGIVWMQSTRPGTVDLELQWLSLNQGSTTEPRELIGEVYPYPGIPLEADGSFIWDIGQMVLPGEANPITGSDIVFEAVLDVAPLGSPYCGSVDGLVTSPIQVPLDGSTHAMTAVPSEAELPLEFPVACP